MPLTTLDPRTALIIVDLQKGIVSSPFIHPIDDVVQRSRALIDTFRTQGLPVDSSTSPVERRDGRATAPTESTAGGMD